MMVVVMAAKRVSDKGVEGDFWRREGEWEGVAVEDVDWSVEEVETVFEEEGDFLRGRHLITASMLARQGWTWSG